MNTSSHNDRLVWVGVVAALLATALDGAVLPLELQVTVDKLRFSSDEEIRVTMTLKNISVGPIALPAISPDNQSLYLRLATNDDRGTPLFWIPPPIDDRAVNSATGTVVLQRNQQIVFTDTVNRGAMGLLKYRRKDDPTSIEVVSGKVIVTATLVVDASNKPTGGDLGVFLGTIPSVITASFIAVPKESGDLNADGRVDCSDLQMVQAALGKQRGQPGFDSRADLNDDRVVDATDLQLVSQKLPRNTKCP